MSSNEVSAWDTNVSTRNMIGKTLDYEILSSGSHGNAVRIENILFDCGIPYKNLRKVLPKIKYLLITHAHSDHICPATLKKIKSDFPRIKIIGNWDVDFKHGVTYRATEKAFEMGDWVVKPFECIHNVLTYGYVLEQGKMSLIYATDTNNLDMIARSVKFDYIFIEANYDEIKLNEMRKRNDYKYDVFRNAQRHLSKQKSEAFYYIHRKNKDSLYVELHKSARFY